ncbi:MAG: hypothetical protein ACREA8_10245 [Nitrosotalea sp.]
MECSFAVYCDTERASDIKIHKIDCGEHKKREGHDHEWFYAPTYKNAKIISELLSKDRHLRYSDCQHCKPSTVT